MKLLFIYQFCTLGGVETVIANRLKALNSRDMKIDALFLQDFGGKSIFKDFMNSVHITNDYTKIAALLEKEKYDCIINIDMPQIFSILSKLSYRPLVILEVHTMYKENLEYLNQVDNKIISAIITPSSYMVTLINQRINVDIPIHVIPNSVGNQFLDNEDLNPAIDIKKKLIGWVGRFDDYKNWRNFIDIAEYLLSTDKNYEFCMIGGIAAPKHIKEEFHLRAKSKGILSSLRWFPKIECMPNFYKLISKSGGCILSTSIDESFGMVVLESMASRCPVVAPNVGGITELLDNDSGLLYPSGDIKLAALSIYQLVTDIQLRTTIIDNAYKKVLIKYISEKVVNDWKNLIKLYYNNNQKEKISESKNFKIDSKNDTIFSKFFIRIFRTKKASESNNKELNIK